MDVFELHKMLIEFMVIKINDLILKVHLITAAPHQLYDFSRSTFRIFYFLFFFHKFTASQEGKEYKRFSDLSEFS